MGLCADEGISVIGVDVVVVVDSTLVDVLEAALGEESIDGMVVALVVDEVCEVELGELVFAGCATEQAARAT